MSKQIHIFGIRHHGPGSARSLLRALHELQPDCLLVEGPPDAEPVLHLAAHRQMKPPVALLIYRPDDPRQAAYYPFALFSPEWQALTYALQHHLPLHFMDLPQSIRLATDERQTTNDEEDPITDHEASATDNQQPTADDEQFKTQNSKLKIESDPLGWIAQAAGFSDGERWWEHMVEHRRDGTHLFAGILEMMSALRQAADQDDEPRTTTDESNDLLTTDNRQLTTGNSKIEAQREAYMRTTIRRAQSEGFTRIAVVCGAWHAPVLATMPRTQDEDAATLKGLPTVRVQATWVPWTHGRLSYYTGYGAGIESPGWYHHLWSTSHTTTSDVTIRWMSRVANLLREQDLDASTAHVIDAVRLAEGLATLRERPLPGLPELNEATRAVLLSGDDVAMRLIHDKLIVGETLGDVPDDTPAVPLQGDLRREQRRLRLPPEPTIRTLDLDLRNPNDLARSHLLHRLSILSVPWGRLQRTGTRAKGTFHEIWQLQWQPELAVSIIEAGIWGNTLLDAATARLNHEAGMASDLPTLTTLADRALLAALPAAVVPIMARVQSEAAVSTDVNHLMDALPPLANIVRYGNVRGTDAGMVSHVVDGLVARIDIGLPGACASLNDEAAEEMYNRIIAVHSAITLLSNDDYTGSWQRALTSIAGQTGVHGLVAGRAVRILMDSDLLSREEAARRMGLALSRASDPPAAAAWLEGFLKGSGMALLHDDALWDVLDTWVTGLHSDAFTALLPLLRRTFSTFPAPERRQMGQRAARGLSTSRPLQPTTATPPNFDQSRAEAILPLISQLLGLTPKENEPSP
ncbi:MAG: DUF5682 family protein [Chloroflexia bacterium]